MTADQLLTGNPRCEHCAAHHPISYDCRAAMKRHLESMRFVSPAEGMTLDEAMERLAATVKAATAGEAAKSPADAKRLAFMADIQTVLDEVERLKGNYQGYQQMLLNVTYAKQSAEARVKALEDALGVAKTALQRVKDYDDETTNITNSVVAVVDAAIAKAAAALGAKP